MNTPKKMNDNKYTICFDVSEKEIEMLNGLIKSLACTIDFYTIKISVPHITICNFMGNNVTLEKWKDYCKTFAQKTLELAIAFDRTAPFSNGAFVILPNEESHQNLKGIVKYFFTNRPHFNAIKSAKPHLTLLRKLSIEQNQKAFESLSSIDIKCKIESMSIRQYHALSNTYDLIAQYYFTCKV